LAIPRVSFEERETALSDRLAKAQRGDAAAYREFIASYEPRLSRERQAPALTDEQAFVERLQLVQDFRRFLYIDPGLPSTLLSAHWPATAASALFRDYYAVLSSKAGNFFEAAFEPQYR